jgi:CHAT domain-containing protein
VLERAGDPKWIDLGEVSAIDARVTTLRAALANPASDPKPAARALEASVFAPVRARIGDTRWALLSPDGLLDLVPFDALVDETGHYLVEGWAFSYLTSGRDLLRLESPAAPRSGAVVIGDPSFGVRGAPSAEGSPSGQRSIDMARVHFAELPGAVREVKAVAAALPHSVLLVRDDATESAVKALQGPSVLHVATHGFFLPPQSDPATAANGRSAIENPLLRSGIALAGANTHRRDGEDGILTALEASSLDLDGTKLVTLSACETGLGDATGGEGVYGLRRALVLAGAESQVMSLWKVEDDATRELMAAYYARLAAGEGRASALRAVELEVRRKHPHPYYWAAFLLSGAWSSFDGTSSTPDFAKVAPSSRGCACAVPASSGEGGVAAWVAVCAIFLGASARRRRSS